MDESYEKFVSQYSTVLESNTADIRNPEAKERIWKATYNELCTQQSVDPKKVDLKSQEVKQATVGADRSRLRNALRAIERHPLAGYPHFDCLKDFLTWVTPTLKKFPLFERTVMAIWMVLEPRNKGPEIAKLWNGVFSELLMEFEPGEMPQNVEKTLAKVREKLMARVSELPHSNWLCELIEHRNDVKVEVEAWVRLYIVRMEAPSERFRGAQSGGRTDNYGKFRNIWRDNKKYLWLRLVKLKKSQLRAKRKGANHEDSPFK